MNLTNHFQQKFDLAPKNGADFGVFGMGWIRRSLFYPLGKKHRF